MERQGMKIAIIGGGIGGLTSALALTQAGFAVEVYERTPRLLDQGAGISLSPNATRVLYHLGLGPPLETTAVTQPVSEYRHYRTGTVIKRVVREDNRERYGAPHLRMHRWDLQNVMATRLGELAPGALRLGSRLDHLRSHNSGVELRFEGHRTTIVDAVVAADGIHSEIRKTLFNPAPPTFTGFVAWRGLVSTPGMPQHLLESVVSFGQGRHLNRYLVRRGELLNFVAIARRDEWQAEGWTIPASLPEFLAEYADFDADTQAIISRPLHGQLFKWGLFGHAWLNSWSTKRIVLLGDAAHPMLPFQGQGAAMAIEDAMILARCLTSENETERAFALYQATRSGRVKRATEGAANQAHLYVGEPNEDSLKTDERGDLFAYDAVSASLG
jgi:salicylate hydroxylase